METALLDFGVGMLLLGLLVFYVSTIARLRRIERKLNALLRHHGVDPTQDPPLSERVKQLAAEPGRKIDAITAYCEETGAGLAEAKEAIESFTKNKGQ
jgi:ribosomal protein L7/L12